MNTSSISIKRALISVSNKTGIVGFAKGLYAVGVEIISTGGTAKVLQEAGMPVKEIFEYTGFPEMMEGRVKTLHPKVLGGILGLRDRHADVAQVHSIPWIDLVVCNLYPFAETIQKPNASFDEVIENIDIGGPSMIRAAAKNMGWVTVLIDPADYTPILQELQTGGVSFVTRKKLAAKAFTHTARYDAIIDEYFQKKESLSPLVGGTEGGFVLNPRTSLLMRTPPPPPLQGEESTFPAVINLTFKKYYDLRYGENPHQAGCVYKLSATPARNPAQCGKPTSDCNILNAKILQGKQLSYNNVNDADGALATLKEFTEPTCVVVKHANPCGVAAGTDISEVYQRAYNADPLSAFGGIIALNRPCTEAIAMHTASVFAEIVLAPSFEPGAVEILAQKKNLRVLELGPIPLAVPRLEYRSVEGGLLVQDTDTKILSEADLKVATTKIPTALEIQAMLFAWRVLKHIKSNAILLAKNNTTIGMGAGQVSRIDSVDIAIKKAGQNIAGTILASDAFFPFRDSIDRIVGKGIMAIIQPGGSIRDQEVINACNEHGIAMVFTGIRCFKH